MNSWLLYVVILVAWGVIQAITKARQNAEKQEPPRQAKQKPSPARGQGRRSDAAMGSAAGSGSGSGSGAGAGSGSDQTAVPTAVDTVASRREAQLEQLRQRRAQRLGQAKDARNNAPAAVRSGSGSGSGAVDVAAASSTVGRRSARVARPQTIEIVAATHEAAETASRRQVAPEPTLQDRRTTQMRSAAARQAATSRKPGELTRREIIKQTAITDVVAETEVGSASRRGRTGKASSTAVSSLAVRQAMNNPQRLRELFVMKELLDPPRGLE